MLLAGVHLAVAIPLMVWIEADDVAHFKYLPRYTKSAEPIHADSVQEGGSVAFDIDSCKMHTGAEFRPAALVRSANLPATIFVGWRSICPANWSLAGMLHISMWRPSIEGERQLNLALCLLILVQWFLVGSFPLRQPRRWWWEPGAFITLCTLVALVLVLIHVTRDFSTFPMLFAVLAWLYWFALLVWKILRGGWRLATQ